VSAVFPLERAASALDQVLARKSTGKVVIVMDACVETTYSPQ
jgi:hypothetical protein